MSSVFMLQNYEKLIDELMLFDYSNLSKLPELFEGLSIYDVVAASEVFTLDEAIEHSQVAKAKFVLESILNHTCDFSKVIPLDIKTLYAANDYYAAIKAAQAQA